MVRDAWIAVPLGLVAAAGYFLASRWIGATGVFWHYDLLFDVDTPRVVQDLTCADCPRHRTVTHPAFVLLLNPIGSTLRAIIDAPLAIAQAMTAAAGGTFAGLFYLVLRDRDHGRSVALAGTLLLAGSTAHAAMASIPETSIHSGLAGLLFLFALLRGWARPWRVLCGVVAASFVVTHLALPVVFAGLRPREGRWRESTQDLIAIGIGVVVLALVQGLLHAGSVPFFLPQEVLAEREHVVTVTGVADVLRRVGWVLQNLLQFPVVAPGITEFDGAHPERYYVTLDATRPWQHGLLGLGLLLGWAGLLVHGLVAFLRRPDSLRLGLALAIGVMAVILLPYSDRVFLFSPLWTAWVVLFVLLAPGGRRWATALWVLAGANLLHTSLFLGSIVDAYQGRF